MKISTERYCEDVESEQIDQNECFEGEDLMPYNTEGLPAEATEVVAITECVDNIYNVANCICNAVTTWKEIDMQMHTMDVQFATFAKQMDVNLEMYKQRAPIVGKQLESISEMMNKILDKVLMMDAETEAEINNKMRLMDSVDTYVDRITTMMTKLL